MKKTNIAIILLTAGILLFSLLVLYSSCHQKGEFVRQHIFFRQLTWMGVGCIIMFVMFLFDYRRLRDIAWPLYFLSVFSLLLVLVIGAVRLGAQRWLHWGGVNFQPSELGKVALILVLAHYFSQKSIEDVGGLKRQLSLFKGFIIPLLLTGALAFFVMAQPDLGTALVYIFIFLSLVLFCGIRLRYIFIFLLGLFMLSPVFWFLLRDYQKDRLLVFLNADKDPLGAGYTIIQSKIAIGSGAFFGKGWLSGTQNQLNFLIERHTDFIFSTLGEEWGFIGALVLLALFYFLIHRIIKLSFHVIDPFAKNLCVGIAFLICIQCFINIAMAMGLMPVVGLPLPLMSYGGSSLITFLLLIGVVLNIGKNH